MSANRWPKRLALTGAILLALSTAVMWSSYDEMTVILDPGKNHFLELEDGETEDVNLSNSTSYLIFRLTDVAADCQIIENEIKFYLLSSACAAASLAIGTLKGEQET